MKENKQVPVQNSTGTAVPTRKEAVLHGSDELWYTIPHHLLPKNMREHIHGIGPTWFVSYTPNKNSNSNKQNMRMTKGKMKRKREGGGTNKEEEETREIK